MRWLPVAAFAHMPERSRDYVVARALGALRRELSRRACTFRSCIQALTRSSTTRAMRRAVSATPCSRSHAREPASPRSKAPRRRGPRVAAYYWWIFPNLMLNFYPWGLSVNLVLPEATDRTRVAFRSYVRRRVEARRGCGRRDSTASRPRTRRSSRRCSAACARAITSRDATRRRGSRACTISIGCSRRSSNDGVASDR